MDHLWLPCLVKSPDSVASCLASEALKLIVEEVPHKLSQQVPLWTVEDVAHWVSEVSITCGSLMTPLSSKDSRLHCLTSFQSSFTINRRGVPHKLSQQVPLWTVEDVAHWVSEVSITCGSLMTPLSSKDSRLRCLTPFQSSFTINRRGVPHKLSQQVPLWTGRCGSVGIRGKYYLWITFDSAVF